MDAVRDGMSSDDGGAVPRTVAVGSPRRVLVVAYYFPPMGLSGVQRVAKLVKYLPEHGWQPTVLTVEPGGYFAFDEHLLAETEAAGVSVHRTGSLDPTRLFGRRQRVALPDESTRQLLAVLSQFFFVPDNKIGWWWSAVREGKRILRSAPYDAIFSTAPPYTAHLVAARLSRWSGLPLLTDFRDDWLGNPRHTYPSHLHRTLHHVLEGWVLRQSQMTLTINEPIRQSLARRHPQGRCVTVLPQGFDPEDFSGSQEARPSDTLRFVYSGVFYDAQTPDYFLRGLACMLARHTLPPERIEALFVGMLPDATAGLITELGLDSVVRHVGYRSHPEAVAYLQAADVLWMTVGEQPGAEQISTGKLFEYFGSRKPILGLVPPGAARKALQQYGAAVIVPPDDVSQIAGAMAALVEQWRAGALPVPEEAFVQRFDRRRLAGELAKYLQQCTA